MPVDAPSLSLISSLVSVLTPGAHLSLTPRWSLKIMSTVAVDPGHDRSGMLSPLRLYKAVLFVKRWALLSTMIEVLSLSVILKIPSS